MKTILVTGGAGFIGSNFISYFLEQNSDYKIINLDVLSYAGSLENLNKVKDNPNYKFIKGDICDEGLVDFIFKEFDICGVIHFAACSHVDNSILNPKIFVDTNVSGTFTLLQAAKTYWLDAPFKPKKGYENSKFLHVSTDEVYGSLGKDGYFDESSPYAPNSPYSATKAASDFLARSFFHTYGLNTVITNCSNNYGPHQHEEKLIPTIIKNALSWNKIPIYGNGQNVRDWLYVLDHCAALKLVFDKAKPGQSYAIGGGNEISNIEIAERICALLDAKCPHNNGSFKQLISFVDDRPGHDYRYAILATKIHQELGFKPQTDFETGLEKTLDYYIDKFKG